MTSNLSVIAALERALASAPDDDAIRLHLVGLLLAEQSWSDAAAHCLVVLHRRPTDVQTLRLAATASEGIGDTERATFYRQLINALPGNQPNRDSPAGPPSARGQSSGRTHPTQGESADLTASSSSTRDLPVDDPRSDESGSEGQAPIAVPLNVPFEDEYDQFLRESVAADIERPTLTLADVGGLKEVKRRLNTSFLGPMRNPELRALYGKSLRGGLLLYGPPGCGKTFIARAVAGELQAHFFAVGLGA